MRNVSLFLFLIVIFRISSFSQNQKIEPQKGLIVYLPTTFKKMSDDDMAQKYPSYKKPILVCESEDKKAEIGVNSAVNKWKNNNLSVLKDMYKSTISSIFNQVEYFKEGDIVEINGRKFIQFEFNSTIVDDKRADNTPVYTRRYNFLSYTLYKGKILVFNFNSTYGSGNDWRPIASDIMKSIKISDKLKIEDFEPYKTQGPQPKEINGRKDMQLEAIKKLNKQKN